MKIKVYNNLAIFEQPLIWQIINTAIIDVLVVPRALVGTWDTLDYTVVHILNFLWPNYYSITYKTWDNIWLLSYYDISWAHR